MHNLTNIDTVCQLRNSFRNISGHSKNPFSYLTRIVKYDLLFGAKPFDYFRKYLYPRELDGVIKTYLVVRSVVGLSAYNDSSLDVLDTYYVPI